MTRYDLLIPTIPHRHEVLCALLAELDRQMLPGAGVIVWRDNLEHSYGDKCQGLLEASDADYVAFMDDDDWPSEDYLSAVLGALEGGPDYVGWPEMYTVDGGQGRIIVHSLHDRSAEYPGVQVGLVAHRVLEHPGKMLGQEDGLDQHDHGKGPCRHAGEEAARIVTFYEVGEFGAPAAGRRGGNVGKGAQSRNASPR